MVSFAVRTPGRTWSFRATRGVPSASTLKAVLLVAYLRRRSVRDRALTRGERALLAPMIRRSDNVAATTVWNRLDARRVARFARRAGMRRFVPNPGVWGLSRVDAADLSRFMLHVDTLTPQRHRAYALTLLRTIVPGQRWGVAKAKPRGWALHFKGGWGSGSGAVDHQVALLTKHDERVAVAITSTADGSHAQGKRTLEGVARRLLRGLERVG